MTHLVDELKAKADLVIDTTAHIPFFVGPGESSYAK